MHILSLFDATGAWSQPYRDAGYQVTQIDLTLGSDVLETSAQDFAPVYGILAAPPCTDFSGSGARWWKDKDADGRTAESIALLEYTMSLIHDLNPLWWCLENPVGRLQRLVPEVGERRMTFNPCDYGDPYTKRTCLWGNFNTDLPRNPVEPIIYESAGKRGSWHWAKLGGSSARTKSLRSATPVGFAGAFFQANP